MILTNCQRVAIVLCQSGRFETGEGTCSFVCMDQLGSARQRVHGCSHTLEVHGKLAHQIVDELKVTP